MTVVNYNTVVTNS